MAYKRLSPPIDLGTSLSETLLEAKARLTKKYMNSNFRVSEGYPQGTKSAELWDGPIFNEMMIFFRKAEDWLGDSADDWRKDEEAYFCALPDPDTHDVIMCAYRKLENNGNMLFITNKTTARLLIFDQLMNPEEIV